MTDVLKKLTDLFVTFPGIGRRQAERFVYHLLRQDKDFAKQLAGAIQSLHGVVDTCTDCKRFFVTDGHEHCSICSDKGRDQAKLLLVAKDVDLENIEHSGTYKGKYFVLGGTIPVLDKSPEQKIRIDDLKKYIEMNKPSEIILGLSTHPEGENTRTYVVQELKGLEKTVKFSITTLGRGLSTGAELEYSDPETIKNALANRQ